MFAAYKQMAVFKTGNENDATVFFDAELIGTLCVGLFDMFSIGISLC